MEDLSQNDIRILLKTFGIQANEAILSHLMNAQTGKPLLLRITLEDLTDYGDLPPKAPLHLEVEGQVRC